MQLRDVLEGGFSIYVGATRAEDGHGFVATLVIKKHTDSTVGEQEVFRDDDLTEGARFSSEEAAVAAALQFARDLVARHPERLRSPHS